MIEEGEMPTDEVWALEIVPHDQASDPYARALQEALHDLAARPAVSHGRLYLFQGSHSTQLEEAARKLCLDPIIADARVDRGLDLAGTTRRPDSRDEEGLSWILEILPYP